MTPFYIENVGDEDAKFIINAHEMSIGSSPYYCSFYSSIDNDDYEYLSRSNMFNDHIVFDDYRVVSSYGKIITLQPHQKIYLKSAKDATYKYSNALFRSDFIRVAFLMSGKIALGGNIMSLANPDYVNDNDSPEYCLKRIFNSTIMSKDGNGYLNEDYGRVPCTSIVKAPEFPKIKLSAGCYQEMFYDCANLEGSISLNATELATDCYTDMFHGCEKVSELHFPKSFAHDGNEIFKTMPGQPKFGAVNANVYFDL